MVTQIFGQMLYYPEADSLAEFPSPESLKYRIIISTKPPVEYLEKDSSSLNMRGSFDQVDGSLEAYDSDQDDFDTSESSSRSGQNGAPEYKRLITIHAGKPRGHLKDALQVALDKVKRLSLSEQELERATTSHGTDVVRYVYIKCLHKYLDILLISFSLSITDIYAVVLILGSRRRIFWEFTPREQEWTLQIMSHLSDGLTELRWLHSICR